MVVDAIHASLARETWPKRDDLLTFSNFSTVGRPRKAQAKTRAETGGGRRGRRTTRAGLVASSERDDSGSLGVRLSQRIHGLTPEEPDDIVQAECVSQLFVREGKNAMW